MADEHTILETGRRVRSRTEATVRRASLLVAASRELIQQATREEAATLDLLHSLTEVRDFVEENRRDLRQALRRSGQRPGAD